MAEAANVILVRCPKCENLLPELPGFSLYQCGGCGAVLKAKKKGILEDGSSEITENVKGIGVPEESTAVEVPEVNLENANGIEGVKVERLDNERVASNGSSRSLAESREVLGDSDTNMREQESRSQGLTHNRNQGKKCDLNVDRPEYVHFHNEHVQESRPPLGLSGSRPVVDQWGVKSNGSAVSRGPATGRRSDNLLYHDEGQSSYGLNPHHERKERSRYQHDALDEIGRFEDLEIGRAELLRKLDELKDQITRSYHVAEKPDPYGKQCVNKKPLALNDTGPSYLSQTGGFMPYREGYRSSGLGKYVQRGYPHECPPYADVYQPEVFQRPPRRSQSQYMHRPYHGHYPGYMDANQDLFMLHPHENIFHQPACSCVHCRDKNWHMPPKIDPSSYHSRRSRNELSNSNVYHNPLPTVRSSKLHPLHSRRGPVLNSSVLDSENNGFNHRFPRKLGVAHRSSQVSYPVAGGAPFITCSNCFELLKLPTRHISSKMDQKKMKCGACSSIILFELGDEGLITSISPNGDQVGTEVDQGSSGTLDGNMGYWNNGSNDDNMNSCSNNYDDFQEFSPPDKRSNSEVSEKHLDPLSSSSLSEDEQSPERSISRKHGSEGQRSKRSAQERVSLDKNSSRQDSLKDVAVATEIDVPLNEFANSCVSQDSVDSNKEDQAKFNKGGDSFFAGLIKKSLRDLIKSNHEVGGSQVSVNGHLIPDREVKKAEKLAGPIQPGEYWYDKRAGFWGVMSHPCMGIIMPNIEEFNYPMPANCSAGNTGVFVNGRELHQKDLDLLATRGLPITNHKSYLIDITGKVVDEHTGEELDGLGKLAPTVEKAKHGFGMKVPRFVSQLQD